MTRYTRNPTTQQRTAALRLMAYAGRINGARERRDWVAVADLRTSTDDCRIALRALAGEAS